ncbi:outer membrane protein assembly factor BamD [Lutimonas vermicola]|uniref:Outer membrane protein assembly factor BamD n=1 Tax=Lutimonas vermicola TaxID=414288 RepID=A0ABU9KYR7_9FLAO
MKKLALIMLMSFLMGSCGEYQKVLNKGKNTEKYQMAVAMYEKKEYKKAITLFEKIMGPYANKPQMERIQYMISDCYFQTENYTMASYYFSKFITNYPESTKAQEAAYLSARSYYLASPVYSRDQEDTYKALTAYQDFIDKYPNSEMIEEANKDYAALNRKLQFKDFEVARLYYHTENYKAAIQAFETFNEDHLGSEFKEETYYYSFKSAYALGMNSVITKKEERLNDAIRSYKKFQKSFPESDRMKELNGSYAKLEQELMKTKELFTTISQNN